MFIDRIEIYVKAGNGGNGAVSFHREKYVSHGGPDGGDGGHGGNIVMRVDPGSNTLLAFRYHRKFVAANGENGSGKKFHGASAPDTVILVPPGTVIKEAESGLVIHDMSENGGADFTVCRGGRGGWGNRHFATPTRQVPMFAKSGTAGEEKNLLLELKMIADVGIIGFPSVGKSSLLAGISAARPKIAGYHFTTLSPNLGVVSLPSDNGGRGFVAADIPGLIEGAADGAGLGHQFLRHTERCRLLLHVVDIASTEGRDPSDDLKKIDAELSKYSPELALRPQIVVANKCDCADREAEYVKEFERLVASLGRKLYYVSAMTGEGLDELVEATAAELEKLPPVKVFEAEITPEDRLSRGAAERKTEYRRVGNTFYVEGEWLFNLCGQVNFADYESLNFFRRVLKKSGVIDELEAMGCTDGCTVSIYDFEFDYVK